MAGGIGTSIAFLILTGISAVASAGMSPWVVAAGLLLFGLTAGYGFPAQLNIMVDYFPVIRGTAGALQFFGRFIGTTIAPILGGALTDSFGLPSGFGLTTAFLTLGALVAYFTVANPSPALEVIPE